MMIKQSCCKFPTCREKRFVRRTLGDLPCHNVSQTGRSVTRRDNHE